MRTPGVISRDVARFSCGTFDRVREKPVGTREEFGFRFAHGWRTDTDQIDMGPRTDRIMP